MFKILRKYNKLLLAIFGVLLMITFLIPTAFNKFGREAGSHRATIATVGNGQKVTGDDWSNAQSQLLFLQRIAPLMAMRGASGPVIDSLQKMKPEQWYLMVREAKQAGLIPAAGSIEIGNDALIQFANLGQQRDPNFIRDTITDLIGVEQMIRLCQYGGMYSDRRIKAAAERLLHQVVVQTVVLKADVADAPEPTEDEILAQFKKYADQTPGGNGPGFGYKIPDRVKLEWLEISSAAVRKSVESSEDFNDVAKRMHWRRYENDPRKGFPKRDSSIEIPQVVAHDLSDELTKEKLEEISKYASDQLRLNRRGIPEKDGYAVLPPDWDKRQLSFTDLAKDLQAKFGIDLPAYQSTGDRWVDKTEINNLPGISKAWTGKYGPSPLTLADLVEQTRELRTKGPVSVYIQKGIAGPPIQVPASDLYFFRILDVEAAHQAQSVDEVRPQVVADLKRMANYKRLADSAPQLTEQVQNSGLVKFAIDHDTVVQRTATVSMANRYVLMQQASSGARLTLTPTDLPEIGADREAVQAIIDYARSLPMDVPVDSLTPQQKFHVVPVPDKLAVLVVELKAQNPVTQEDFASLVQMGVLHQLLADEDTQGADVLDQAYSRDALVKRNNFVFSRPAANEESDAPASSAANAG